MAIEGTVLITGANGSLALPYVQQLLEKYPSFSAILTVRDASDKDPNTNELRKILSKFPSAKATIEVLDLARLENVRQFADAIANKVSTGKFPPISTVRSP
jgi:NAD(P)-dependent dehydrogenase (short-subunit alcohol dehydrogenase family)